MRYLFTVAMQLLGFCVKLNWPMTTCEGNSLYLAWTVPVTSQTVSITSQPNTCNFPMAIHAKWQQKREQVCNQHCVSKIELARIVIVDGDLTTVKGELWNSLVRQCDSSSSMWICCSGKLMLVCGLMTCCQHSRDDLMLFITCALMHTVVDLFRLRCPVLSWMIFSGTSA